MASIKPLGKKRPRNVFAGKDFVKFYAPKQPETLRRLMAAGDARYDPRRAALSGTDSNNENTFLELLRDSDPVPPHSDDVGGGAPATAYQPRWTFAPVVMQAAIPAAFFHHFLHGNAGRPNDRRRPLVAQRALKDDAAISPLVESRLRQLLAQSQGASLELGANFHRLDFERADSRRAGAAGSASPVTAVPEGGSKTAGRADGVFGQLARAIPVPPMAPTPPSYAEGTVTERILRKLVHDMDEGFVSVGSPAVLRIHQPELAVKDAMRVEVARGVHVDPNDREAQLQRLDRLRFAEILLVPGDVAYVPRGLTYDLVQPSVTMATGTPTSKLRKKGLLPVDIRESSARPTLTVGALTASEQIRRADADAKALGDGCGEAQRVPLVAWRWRFAAFPDFTDRSVHPSPYVAANHMGSNIAQLYQRQRR